MEGRLREKTSRSQNSSAYLRVWWDVSTAWNPKQPETSGCSNMAIEILYIGNGCDWENINFFLVGTGVPGGRNPQTLEWIFAFFLPQEVQSLGAIEAADG